MIPYNPPLVYIHNYNLQKFKTPIEIFQEVLQQGKSEDIKKFIDGHSVLNVSDNHGWNMLLHSIVAKNDIAIKYLLEKGSTINYKDNYENTPLMCAVYTRNRELIDVIIKNGGNINDRNAYGISALMLICSMTDMNDIAKLLIDYGADVNLKDVTGKTPLMNAVISGNIETLELLIKNGSLVEEKDNIGDTALMKVMCRKNSDFLTNIKIVNILMDNGADVNTRNKFGISPLMRVFVHIVLKGFGLMLKREEFTRQRRLLSKLMEPRMVYVPPDNYVPHVYPLYSINNLIELDRINMGIVEFLVKNGAYINNTDNVGRTALMFASILGLQGTVLFLISSGADLRIKDKQKFTAMDYAIIHGNNILSILKREMMKIMNVRQRLFFNISIICKKAAIRLRVWGTSRY